MWKSRQRAAAIMIGLTTVMNHSSGPCGPPSIRVSTRVELKISTKPQSFSRCLRTSFLRSAIQA